MLCKGRQPLKVQGLFSLWGLPWGPLTSLYECRRGSQKLNLVSRSWKLLRPGDQNYTPNVAGGLGSPLQKDLPCGLVVGWAMACIPRSVAWRALLDPCTGQHRGPASPGALGHTPHRLHPGDQRGVVMGELTPGP